MLVPLAAAMPLSSALRDQAKLAREFRQAQAKLEQGWDFLRKLQQLDQAQHAERDNAAPLQ